MELDWSTFILEIINFLVLLWILKRFLYQPVLAVIARRQATIEDSMQAATSLKQQAEAARVQYDARLQEWQQEHDRRLAQLQQELAAERERQKRLLDDELVQMRAKAKTLEQRERAQQRHDMEAQALQQATQFASRFLLPFASASVHEQLLELAAQQLSAFDAHQRSCLRPLTATDTASAVVATAYALDKAQQQRWSSLLADIHGSAMSTRFVEDTTLLAGIHITFGAWALKASLRDELQAFAELAS